MNMSYNSGDNKLTLSDNTDSDDLNDSSHKLHEFEMQLTKLESAKDQLLAQLKIEKQDVIDKYEKILESLKKDLSGVKQSSVREINDLKSEMNLKESAYKRQVDDITKQKYTCEQKFNEDMTLLSLKMQQISDELNQTKNNSEKLINDLHSIIKDKDKYINDLQNDKKQLETDLRQEIQNLLKNIEDINKKLSEVVMNRDTALSRVIQLEAQIITLKNESEMQLTKLDSTKDQMLAQLNIEKQSIIDKYEQIVEMLKKDLSDLKQSSAKEVINIKSEMNLKEISYKEQIDNLTKQKFLCEQKFAEEMNSNFLKMQQMKDESNQTKNNSEKLINDLHSIIKDKDKYITDLQNDKKQSETDLKQEIQNLLKNIEDSNKKLSEVVINRDTAFSRVIQLEGQIITLKNEKEVLKSSLLNVNEKYYGLEVTNDALNKELEKLKVLMEKENKEKREKLQSFDYLTNALRENQSEAERLSKSLTDIENSYRECEDTRTLIMQDCNELRTTLMEVEKSRLEIRRELSNTKVNCTTFQNKLKLKENENQELSRRIETLTEERNSLKESLESSRKSLMEIKDINTQLSTRNKQFQAQISLYETERREAERHVNTMTNTLTDKDSEIISLKRDYESLRDKLNKIETEKKRLERSYTLIEKEKSTLKNNLDSIQRKSNKSVQYSPRSDPFVDEAKIITQGLAVLEQKNIELQRRVQGLQSLMNESEIANNSAINGNETSANNLINNSGKLVTSQKRTQTLNDKTEVSSKHFAELEKEISLNAMLTSTPDRLRDAPSRSSSTSKLLRNHHYDSEQLNIFPLYNSSTALPQVRKKLSCNKK